MSIPTQPVNERKVKPLAAPLFVVLASMLWGTTGTSQAFAPEGATPASVGVVRMVVGGLALLLVVLLRGALPRGKWPWGAVLAAGVGVAAYQLTFFGGVARSGVVAGTIIAIGSSPILAGLLGFLVEGERPRRAWYAATALAVVGVILLSAAKGQLEVDVLGIALAVGAGASYALYSVASKRLLAKWPPFTAAAVALSLGAVLVFPLLFCLDNSWLFQPRGLAVGLHLGLLATALPYMLYARGLTGVRVSSAVTLTLAEPVTASLLGVLVLGERLTPQAVVGIALVFAGLVMISIRRKR